MRRALALVAALTLGAPALAAGLDEARIKEDVGAVTRLLARAGFGEIGKSYALVVGIAEFEAFADLPTGADPIAVRDYLVDDAGFDHVHLLTGDKVTRTRLRELMLDEFGGRIGPDDRFLFYWSGHGHTVRRGAGERGFLPLAASAKDRISTMVSMEEIERWDSYIEAHQVLYLLDACFSGLVGAAAQSDLSEISRALLSGPARHAIAAGRATEQTIAVDALGGSVFTHALLKGLRGSADVGAQGEDGLVSVGELHAYLGVEVTRLRQRYGWEKSITPQIRDLSGSDGAFFFPVPAAFPVDPVAEVAEPGVSLAEVQDALAALGYDPGAADGRLTLKTRTALVRFQQDRGLEATGKLDDATADALPLALASLVAPQGGGGEGDETEADARVAALEVPERPVARPDGAVDAGDAERPCGLCPPMRRVPGTAQIAPFWVAETEVTGSQFRAMIRPGALENVFKADLTDCYGWTGDNKLRRTINAENHWSFVDGEMPVSCVNRSDVARYLDWLNANTDGPAFRLPTEAEMAYLLSEESKEVARLRQLAERGVGSQEWVCLAGNYADASSSFDWRNTLCHDGHSGVAPVARYMADGNGLYDVSGNVWEWMAECWRDQPSAPARDDGCATGTVRGASFDDPLRNVSPEMRQPVPADRRQANIGFRVVRDVR